MLTHSYSSISMFENCPLRYYRQRVLKDVVDTGGIAATYGTEVHTALETRLRDKKSLPSHIKKHEKWCLSIESLGGSILLEEKIALSKKMAPVYFTSDAAWMRAIVDVLVVRGNTAWAFDWKTGKRRPGSFQLRMNAGMVFRIFPQVTRIRTAFIWLKEDTVDQEIFQRKNEKQEVWSDVLPRIKRVEQAFKADKWPAKPSGLCRFCPARDSCDFALL